METLTEELREYHMEEREIKRIIRTLEQGKTVRTVSAPEIESIFWNDDSNAEIVLTTGQYVERKLA
jgi:hypothetical protein